MARVYKCYILLLFPKITLMCDARFVGKCRDYARALLIEEMVLPELGATYLVSLPMFIKLEHTIGVEDVEAWM